MKWFKRYQCQHPRVICLHGDAVNVQGARSYCDVCGKHFKTLPEICYYTKAKHTARSLFGVSIKDRTALVPVYRYEGGDWRTKELWYRNTFLM